MIRTEDDFKADENPCGGKGTANLHNWLGEKELIPNVNLMATIHLSVGGIIGDHEHIGEAEVYRVVSGTGKYNDNGVVKTITEGDTTVCYDGEVHGVENIGDDEFVFIGFIVKS